MLVYNHSNTKLILYNVNRYQKLNTSYKSTSIKQLACFKNWLKINHFNRVTSLSILTRGRCHNEVDK